MTVIIPLCSSWYSTARSLLRLTDHARSVESWQFRSDFSDRNQINLFPFFSGPTEKKIENCCDNGDEDDDKSQYNHPHHHRPPPLKSMGTFLPTCVLSIGTPPRSLLFRYLSRFCTLELICNLWEPYCKDCLAWRGAWIRRRHRLCLGSWVSRFQQVVRFFVGDLAPAGQTPFAALYSGIPPLLSSPYHLFWYAAYRWDDFSPMASPVKWVNGLICCPPPRVVIIFQKKLDRSYQCKKIVFYYV